MAKFKVGDKVVFLESGLHMHRIAPDWYPVPGTVGVISETLKSKCVGLSLGDTCYVQWDDGSTSGDDLWNCPYVFLKKFEHGDCMDNCRTSIIPKRILRSGDRTIVFWQDGTKTIVKRAEDEADNDYTAFTAALAIKTFGSNSALKRMIDKKLEHQKTKAEKKERPLHAEPVDDAMAKIGAMAIDGLVKKATEFTESISQRIVIDVGPVVKEDDKK